MTVKLRTARNLTTALNRHRGQRTVLGIAIPVLIATIGSLKANTHFHGLSEREITLAFRELCSQYLNSDYHPTYIQRRLGPKGFLAINGDRYRFRDELLTGMSLLQLEQLREELRASLQSAAEQRAAMIKAIEETCSLPPEEIEARNRAIVEFIVQIKGNQGEVFEVISFAVLREYFRCFGFSLQRFSTTHANDGGMDFIGGEAIYQVTCDESNQNIKRDLRKAPGTKRVLVRPVISDEMLNELGEQVLDTVEIKDLLNHFLAWLLSRDSRSRSASHLQQVLRGACEEFKRETNAAGA
jgi:hypothetical protein